MDPAWSLRPKHRTLPRADIRLVRTYPRGKLTTSISIFYIGPSLCAVCTVHTAPSGTPMSRFEWEHIPSLGGVLQNQSPGGLLPVSGQCGACSCIYKPKPNFQTPYCTLRSEHGYRSCSPSPDQPCKSQDADNRPSCFFLFLFCSAKSMLRCLVCGPASPSHSRSKPK